VIENADDKNGSVPPPCGRGWGEGLCPQLILLCSLLTFTIIQFLIKSVQGGVKCPHPCPLPQGGGEKESPLPQGEGEKESPLPQGEVVKSLLESALFITDGSYCRSVKG
jgi:hypothetical protein